MMICWIKSTIKDDWCVDEEHVTKTHQQFIVLSELWRELWSCQRFCLCWLWHRRWHRGLSLDKALRHQGALRFIRYSWKQRLNSQWLNSRCQIVQSLRDRSDTRWVGDVLRNWIDHPWQSMALLLPWTFRLLCNGNLILKWKRNSNWSALSKRCISCSNMPCMILQ